MEPVFNAWRWTALTPLPSWVLVAAALGLVLAVWLGWRGIRAERHPLRRRLLVGLRTAAALVVLLLLLEPGIEHLATTKLRGRVAVLVDRSRSMTLPAEPGGASRADVAAKVVGDAEARASLERRFQVDWFAFGAGAVPSDPGSLAGAEGSSAPTLDAEKSELLPSLEEAARAAAGRPLAGLVLLTDGADTGALKDGLAETDATKQQARREELTERLVALGAPVFALDVTGGELRDVSVAALKVDDFAFVRNKVTVDAAIAQRGFGNLTVPVVLERDGQVVATAEASVSDGGRVSVELPFTPDTTGEFVFTVRVPVQAGEAVAANNARTFVLKVIRDRVRVLHVAGRPAWDERFMRSLLKRDPNVDLISFFILRTPSDLTVARQDELSLIPFPTEEIFATQLRSFDLVVFHNFDFKPYRMDVYLPGIAEYVRDGGGFLMLGGDNSFSEGSYAGTPIDEILPVTVRAIAQAVSDDEYRPRLTAEGRRHPVTELAPGEALNDAAWTGLPMLSGANRTTLKPDAQALLVHPSLSDDAGNPLPIVAAMEVGRGRSMAVTTDATWNWAFTGAREGRTQRAYETFYSNAIRWLVRDPELTPVRVNAERERYGPDDRVLLDVKARRRDYGPAVGARVALVLREEAPPVGRPGQVRELEGVVGAEGTVRIEAGSLPAAAWRAEAVVSMEGLELGRAEDAFVVEETGLELAEPLPRPDLLRFIADASEGETYRAASTSLADLPLKDPEKVEIGQRKSEPLWDSAWSLLLLVVLAGTEWWLRRRWGFF